MKGEASDPDFEARVRASFARQKAMTLLGASIRCLAPGVVCATMLATMMVVHDRPGIVD